MKKIFNKNVVPLAVGLLILTIFIAHYFHPQERPFGFGSDTYEYWHLSENLLKYKEYVYTDLSHYPAFDLPDQIIKDFQSKKVPCMVRLPGYPLILALLRAIWDSPWVVVCSIYLTYVGTCLYGFHVGRIFLNNSTYQWVYNILLVLSPVYLTRWGVGSDLPASFFIAGFTYHFLRQTQIEFFSKKHSLLACVCALIAIFTRPNLLVFVGVLGTGAFIWGFMKNQKRICWMGFLVFLTLFISLNLWGFRNKKLCNEWALSTQGGSVLFAVHLSYDLTLHDPLTYWLKEGRGDFFKKNLQQGKTFNQIELELDKKLKSIVGEFYKENPFHLLKKWSDGLRTFFMFSYHDISGLAVCLQRPFSERFQCVMNQQFFTAMQKESRIRNVFFQISRMYKIIVALSFFAFPLIFIKRGRVGSIQNVSLLIVFYIASFSGVLATAFFTGAGGDRMRMPFNVFILIFVVIFISILGEHIKQMFLGNRDYKHND